jgi:hypothetical protein
VPSEYLVENVSDKVTKIVLGYRHHGQPGLSTQRRP